MPLPDGIQRPGVIYIFNSSPPDTRKMQICPTSHDGSARETIAARYLRDNTPPGDPYRYTLKSARASVTSRSGVSICGRIVVSCRARDSRGIDSREKRRGPADESRESQNPPRANPNTTSFSDSTSPLAYYE